MQPKEHWWGRGTTSTAQTKKHTTGCDTRESLHGSTTAAQADLAKSTFSPSSLSMAVTEPSGSKFSAAAGRK